MEPSNISAPCAHGEMTADGNDSMNGFDFCTAQVPPHIDMWNQHYWEYSFNWRPNECSGIKWRVRGASAVGLMGSNGKVQQIAGPDPGPDGWITVILDSGSPNGSTQSIYVIWGGSQPRIEAGSKGDCFGTIVNGVPTNCGGRSDGRDITIRPATSFTLGEISYQSNIKEAKCFESTDIPLSINLAGPIITPFTQTCTWSVVDNPNWQIVSTSGNLATVRALPNAAPATIRVKVTDGCYTTYKQKLINVSPSTITPPNAIFEPQGDNCKESSKTYSVASLTTPSPALAYEWSIVNDGGSTAFLNGAAGQKTVSKTTNKETMLVSFGNASSLTLRVRAQYPCGWSNYTTRVLSTQVTPVPSISLSSPNAACKNQTAVNYSVVSPTPAPLNYTWEIVNPGAERFASNNATSISGAGASVNINMNNTTNTKVQVRVRANYTCGGLSTWSEVFTTNINGSPVAITQGLPNTNCYNGSGSFSIEPVAGAASYTWTVSNNARIASNNSTTLPNTSSNFISVNYLNTSSNADAPVTISVVANYNNCPPNGTLTSSAPTTLIITPTSGYPSGITIEPKAEYCADPKVFTLKANFVGLMVSHSWIVKDNTNTSPSTTTIVVNGLTSTCTATFDYIPTVINAQIQASNYCVMNENKLFPTSPFPLTIGTPDPTTPHGAVNCYIGERKGQELTNIDLYPNPASREVTVRLPEKEEYAQVNIVDALGKIQKSVHATSNETQISLEGLPVGMYSVIIQTSQQKVAKSLAIQY